MSASEFAFLAIGLALGVATGAALVEVLRSRPPAPREVRVTVAPDSVPTRSTTLSGDPFSPRLTGPAPDGPGDRRADDRSIVGPALFIAASPTDPNRTPVPSNGRGAVPLAPGGSLGAPAGPSTHSMSGVVGSPAASPVACDDRSVIGIAIRPEADGIDAALLAAEARAALVLGVATERVGVGIDGPPEAEAEAERDAQAHMATASVAVLTAVAEMPVGSPVATPAGGAMAAGATREMAAGAAAAGEAGEMTDGETGAGAAAAAWVAPAVSGPCAELAAIAQDRCAVAARARQGATTARDTLRAAQRTYDDHVTRAEEAAATADPRAVQSAKEAAQLAFRTARAAALDRDALDHAAADWLASVNRINTTVREASAVASREQAAARALVLVIERLALEADAARITAESAEETCLAARQAVAECQELEAAVRPTPLPPGRSGSAGFGEPGEGTRYPAEVPAATREEPGEAPADRDARILRILRGDGDALRRTVVELGGEDPGERSRWQFQLTGLADAIMAQAMDAGAIDVVPDHPFWEPFSREQCRDIVAALASLGYRFDGLGGFADGRVPSQRDVSLAVGYAGLDPMRIRSWPNETEMRGLFAGASVAADEYLAGAAGGLTLGELVALLGPRADSLTELWNEWGRARPRLLATD